MDAQPVASSTPLAGGHLLRAISTSIVGILRDHYGRGPIEGQDLVFDDLITVVMRGSGFTPNPSRAIGATSGVLNSLNSAATKGRA